MSEKRNKTSLRVQGYMNQEHQHEAPGVEPKRKGAGTCRSLIWAHRNPVPPPLPSWERPLAQQNVKWAEAKSSDFERYLVRD